MNPIVKQKLRHFGKASWNFLVFLWKYCWNMPYLRFLNVGFVNLVFMFAIGILLDFLLRGSISTFFIALLVNIFYMSFSFVTRKMFVYKTKGNWLREYLRCYALYGASIVIAVPILWIFVDAFNFAFWSAQALSIFCAMLFYSLTSRYFAFMRVEEHENNMSGMKDIKGIEDKRNMESVKNIHDIHDAHDVKK